VGLVGGDGGHDVIVLAEGDIGALLGRLVRVPQEHAAFVAAGSDELSLLARKSHIGVARVWSTTPTRLVNPHDPQMQRLVPNLNKDWKNVEYKSNKLKLPLDGDEVMLLGAMGEGQKEKPGLKGDTGVQCSGGLGWRVGVAQSGQRDKSGPGRAGKVGRGDGQQTRLRVVCQGIALVAHLQRGGHRRRLRAHSVHLQQCQTKRKE
jgi:hypothetical protein